MTQDANEVIDVEEQEKPILGQVPPQGDDEVWGDYNGMDISSLCRDEGIRTYFKMLHKNYLHCGGITLA